MSVGDFTEIRSLVKKKNKKKQTKNRGKKENNGFYGYD
tara:strand:+ start:585 stop:698 length:114 start_codon:yes stop_codon:yes gene_type:complete